MKIYRRAVTSCNGNLSLSETNGQFRTILLLEGQLFRFTVNQLLFAYENFSQKPGHREYFTIAVNQFLTYGCTNNKTVN